MADIVTGMFYSRRGFLALLGGVGLAASMPAAAQKLLEAEESDLLPLAQLMPAGYKAYTANPNFASIWGSFRTPPTKTEAGLMWVEEDAAGEMQVQIWGPETSIERADAEEFYRVSRFKSWRTIAQLHDLVQGRGPWVVRLTCHGHYLGLVGKTIAPRLLAMRRIDPEWCDADEGGFSKDIKSAALFSSEQVLHLVPRLQATIGPANDDDEVLLYEPVLPERAFKDLRVLQLRKSGWGPQVGQTYDLEDLEQIFKPKAPLQLGDKNPFVRVPDAWLALISYGKGPGKAVLHSARALAWNCDCPLDDDGNAPGCNCYPAALRGNEEMVLAHLFLRNGARGRFTYVGLGHMPPSEYRTGVDFDIVPSVKMDFYQSLGGDISWQAAAWADDGDWQELPLNSPAALKKSLAAVGEIRAGTFSLSRWGPESIDMRLHKNACIVCYRGSKHSADNGKFLIDPNFKGNAKAPAKLAGETDDEIVNANNILPRTIIPELVKALLKGKGDPPWPERWDLPHEEPKSEEATTQDDD